MANEKFCSNCGAKLSAEAEFCGECGAKQTVAQAESTPVENTVAQENIQTVDNNGGVTQAGISLSNENLKKYLPFVGIGAGALVLIIIAVVIIVNLTKWTKINPSDICRVDFSGLNGSGSAEASFAFDEETTMYLDYIFKYDDDVKASEIAKVVKKLDADDIEDLGIEKDDIKEYFGDKDIKVSDYVSIDEDTLLDAFKKAKDEDEAVEMRDALLDSVEFKLADKKKNGSLKNGDKIKIKVEFDEDDLKEYGIKITEEEFEVTVSGLKDAEELDVFKDVKVEFTGIDGDGDATLNIEGCSDFVKDNFSFYVSPDWNLSLGETVTLSAYYKDYDYDDELGGVYDEDSDTYYLFEEECEKQITVEGLTPLEEVDVFEWVDITYDGVAPSDVDVDWEWKDGTPDYIKDNVSISGYGWSVDDGETITFSAYAYSSFAEDGYKLKSEEMQFVVDFAKVPAYATAEDAKNGTAVDEYLDTFFDDDWFEYIYYGGKGYVESVDSKTLKNTYFKYNKEQGDSWMTNNVYVQVYEVNAKAGGDSIKFYIAISVKNVLSLDGSLVADDYYISSRTFTSLDDVKKEYGTSDDDYTVTQIK